MIMNGLLLVILVMIIPALPQQEHFLLQVSFLDVGQGDAIYIRTPAGNDMLIDGGPDDTVLRQLKTIMPAYDTAFDVIVATHPDKDHIAGLTYVLDHYRADYFLETSKQSGTMIDTILRKKLSEKNITSLQPMRGTRIILDSTYGVFLDILFPDQDTSDFKDTNEASLIMRLVYQDIQVLLTGDTNSSVEQFLARNDPLSLPSNVLQLGHHGSKTSSSDVFLKTVKPEIAVASAGKNNSYGHPATQVVDRVLKNNITLITTKDSGTITFLSDGKNIWDK